MTRKSRDWKSESRTSKLERNTLREKVEKTENQTVQVKEGIVRMEKDLENGMEKAKEEVKEEVKKEMTEGRRGKHSGVRDQRA